MKIADLDALTPEGVSHDPSILKRVLLRRDEVPHVMQLARATFAPGQVAHSHSHPDMWEIFICESGAGSATVDGQTVELHAGRCIVIEPGESHELRGDGVMPMIVTTISVRS